MGICKAMEDMRNEVVERTKIEAAISFLKIGHNSIEEIAGALGLPVETVAELAQSRTA